MLFIEQQFLVIKGKPSRCFFLIILKFAFQAFFFAISQSMHGKMSCIEIKYASFFAKSTPSREFALFEWLFKVFLPLQELFRLDKGIIVLLLLPFKLIRFVLAGKIFCRTWHYFEHILTHNRKSALFWYLSRLFGSIVQILQNEDMIIIIIILLS